jgi:hypothetical protein
VFTARYALSPYIKQISFVFKGLMRHMTHSCPTAKHSFARSEPLRHCGDYAGPQHFVISARFLTVTRNFSSQSLSGRGKTGMLKRQKYLTKIMPFVTHFNTKLTKFIYTKIQLHHRHPSIRFSALQMCHLLVLLVTTTNAVIYLTNSMEQRPS